MKRQTDLKGQAKNHKGLYQSKFRKQEGQPQKKVQEEHERRRLNNVKKNWQTSKTNTTEERTSKYEGSMISDKDCWDTMKVLPGVQSASTCPT